MIKCKECGFKDARSDGVCCDNCLEAWRRRTTDPLYWGRFSHPKKESGMTEETKEKLKEYATKKKESKAAEEAALVADNKAAAKELRKSLKS